MTLAEGHSREDTYPGKLENNDMCLCLFRWKGKLKEAVDLAKEKAQKDAYCTPESYKTTLCVSSYV